MFTQRAIIVNNRAETVVPKAFVLLLTLEPGVFQVGLRQDLASPTATLGVLRYCHEQQAIHELQARLAAPDKRQSPASARVHLDRLLERNARRCMPSWTSILRSAPGARRRRSGCSRRGRACQPAARDRPGKNRSCLRAETADGRLASNTGPWAPRRCGLLRGGRRETPTTPRHCHRSTSPDSPAP